MVFRGTLWQSFARFGIFHQRPEGLRQRSVRRRKGTGPRAPAGVRRAAWGGPAEFAHGAEGWAGGSYASGPGCLWTGAAGGGLPRDGRACRDNPCRGPLGGGPRDHRPPDAYGDGRRVQPGRSRSGVSVWEPLRRFWPSACRPNRLRRRRRRPGRAEAPTREMAWPDHLVLGRRRSGVRNHPLGSQGSPGRPKVKALAQPRRSACRSEGRRARGSRPPARKPLSPS